MKLKLLSNIVFLAAVVVGFLSPLTAVSQENEAEGRIDTSATVGLSFPGEKAGVARILFDSLQYPQTAIDDRVGGRLTIYFIIDTMGMVRPYKIKEGIRADIDNEALRLVGLLNGWRPATRNGKKLEVDFSMSLLFFPDEKFEEEYKRNHSINNTDIILYGNKQP